MSSHPKHASADHDILPPIRERWSPRAFAPDREVPPADLARLFEAARWSSSSFNEQPWRFVVVTRRVAPEVHAELLGSLIEGNQGWASAVPTLVLAVASSVHTKNSTPNNLAWYDTGQAVALLTIQATSMGISIRQMQGFDRDDARKACGVPDGFEPVVVIAIGYEGDPETLPLEKHREQERAPRLRRPISDFVYETRWR